MDRTEFKLEKPDEAKLKLLEEESSTGTKRTTVTSTTTTTTTTGVCLSGTTSSGGESGGVPCDVSPNGCAGGAGGDECANDRVAIVTGGRANDDEGKQLLPTAHTQCLCSSSFAPSSDEVDSANMTKSQLDRLLVSSYHTEDKSTTAGTALSAVTTSGRGQKCLVGQASASAAQENIPALIRGGAGSPGSGGGVLVSRANGDMNNNSQNNSNNRTSFSSKISLNRNSSNTNPNFDMLNSHHGHSHIISKYVFEFEIDLKLLVVNSV